MSALAALRVRIWRRWQRTVVVVLGVVLVAVPTGFAIFPTWTDLALRWRVVIGVGWSLIAIIAVALAAVSDEEMHRKLTQGERRAIIAEHRNALRDQLPSILVPGVGGLPVQYLVTLYGPSPDGQFLIPLFPRALNLRDPAIFPVGVGATGKAWVEPDGTFVVKGDAVWNEEHHLTAEQSRRFRPFQVVAASVIWGDDDERVGVLTTIGRVDDGFFDEENGAVALYELADSLAWVMPEAIHWMLPEEGESE